jgi:DNA-binding MarR family transcriptional regulator
MNDFANWSVDDYLSYLLARASHLVASEFHQEVRAAGLTVLEWRVLATLASGTQHSVGSLADRVLAQQPTVTKLLDRMARAGTIERIAANGDRRRSMVRITAAGRAAIAPLLERSKQHEAARFAALNAREAQVLKGALRKLIGTPCHERVPLTK